MTDVLMTPESLLRMRWSQLCCSQKILKDYRSINVSCDEEFSDLVSATTYFTGISLKTLSEKIEKSINCIIGWRSCEDLPDVKSRKRIVRRVKGVLKKRIRELKGLLRVKGVLEKRMEELDKLFR